MSNTLKRLRQGAAKAWGKRKARLSEVRDMLLEKGEVRNTQIVVIDLETKSEVGRERKSL